MKKNKLALGQKKKNRTWGEGKDEDITVNFQHKDNNITIKN